MRWKKTFERRQPTWPISCAVALAALLALGCHGKTEGAPADGAGQGGWLSGWISRSKPVEMTVPSGTVLALEFGQTLSSESSQPGDRFHARVVEPVYVSEKVAIPVGSTVTGKVVEAVDSRKIGGRARLGLDFDTLTLASGDEVVVQASFEGAGKSQTKKDAATIGGATAGGALLGRIVGHRRGDEGEGTALGAIVGAAAGTAIAATNRGQPVTISKGSVLRVQLDAPVKVTGVG